MTERHFKWLSLVLVGINAISSFALAGGEHGPKYLEPVSPVGFEKRVLSLMDGEDPWLWCVRTQPSKPDEVIVLFDAGEGSDPFDHVKDASKTIWTVERRRSTEVRPIQIFSTRVGSDDKDNLAPRAMIHQSATVSHELAMSVTDAWEAMLNETRYYSGIMIRPSNMEIVDVCFGLHRRRYGQTVLPGHDLPQGLADLAHMLGDLTDLDEGKREAHELVCIKKANEIVAEMKNLHKAESNKSDPKR